MLTERQKKAARKVVQRELDSISKELSNVTPEHRASLYAKATKILATHESLLGTTSGTTLTKSPRQVATCPQCGVTISSERLATHINRVHSTEGLKRRSERVEKRAALEDLVACDICKLEVKRKKLKKHKKDAHNVGVKLRLVSRRGIRAHEAKICAGCKLVKSETWLYKETTKGPVHLCTPCKARYFDSSFGKKDALDFCSFGGGFESNRRRH